MKYLLFLILTFTIACTGTGTDILEPEPGNEGKITIESITNNSISISWEKAIDCRPAMEEEPCSGQSFLEYKVYYSQFDCLNTIDDINQCNSALVANDWTTDISFFTIENLFSDNQYYINIVVRDEEGNIALYSKTIGSTTN